MENASKALIMAAGVLIGILILSLAIYLFLNFGTASAELHQQIAENQINQFNSQFTSYVGKEGVTIYDVISVANLATENNISYNYTKKSISTLTKSDSYIAVILNTKYGIHTNIEYGVETASKTIANAYNDIIAKDIANMQTNADLNQSDLIQYKCIVDISEETRKGL